MPSMKAWEMSFSPDRRSGQRSGPGSREARAGKKSPGAYGV
jgi:hypothetical protein